MHFSWAEVRVMQKLLNKELLNGDLLMKKELQSVLGKFNKYSSLLEKELHYVKERNDIKYNWIMCYAESYYTIMQ